MSELPTTHQSNSSVNIRMKDQDNNMDDLFKQKLDANWISATSTYNYMMKDPLLDWLKYHYGSLTHKYRTFKGINNNNNNNNNRSNDYNFTSYIMNQGILFEQEVMKLITKKFTADRIAEIDGNHQYQNPEKVRETFEAMKRGVPIIHSGVLYNPENKTFGIPDLLVRSDWLKFLVSTSPIPKKLETKKAKKLGTKWHYRVVDIKFTGLMLRADGKHLLNAGSFPAYKSQLLIYNWALGYMQGYTPNETYILGRRWKYTSKDTIYFDNSCFDKLGIINYAGCDKEYITKTNDAIAWIRDVRSDDAADWDIMNYPLARWELYPNMCNPHDYPWRAIKEKIAKQTKELTSLWMVGPKNRNIALKQDVCQWTDPECTPEILGIGKPLAEPTKTGKILSAIIDINQQDKDKILPKYIASNTFGWKDKEAVEFYVDFETCNGVISTMKLPYAKVASIIFMIGVGHINPKTKKWIYKDFTVDQLNSVNEEKICNKFSKYIRKKGKKYGVDDIKCYHWAHAENTMWNDAVDRHDPISDKWKSCDWEWIDLMTIFKEEPIVINGCMSFGLKDVAAAMKNHGFIQTSWDKNSACVDGQSAMVAAKSASDIAIKDGISMRDVPVMKQIVQYNEVDVKVLWEIITYLRDNHTTKPKKNKKRKIAKISQDDSEEDDTITQPLTSRKRIKSKK